ncbi:MAG: hypothetical protein HY402_04195 [Elusimicrobia bacterium]|nr:hypothetical protein [Elusimicrobiota bacterium]
MGARFLLPCLLALWIWAPVTSADEVSVFFLPWVSSSLAAEIQWERVEVSTRAARFPGIPVFSVEISTPVEHLELRIYDVSLAPVWAQDFRHSTRIRGGKGLYEYVWRESSGTPKGVYFYLLRAAKEGYETVEYLNHFRWEGAGAPSSSEGKKTR